ncbi:MAG TPA: DUF6782 family putative metallopeptidase [Terriglobia bacterium]|nr:DUF6782 family putative metallopeptidase [Terriglobia bacterium]
MKIIVFCTPERIRKEAHRAHWPRRSKILAALFAMACFLITVPQAGSREQPQTGPTAVQQQDTAPLLSQADQVLKEMSLLTGLPIKSPVKKKVVSRPEVRELLIHNLHTDYTPAQIHVQEATLRAFGLISKSFDMEKFLISFYTEQAAGFYDPHTQTMYIADWIPPDMQKMVLAHELTHALQDQNFDLEHYMRAVQKDDDAEAARQAVVEGYATAAMFQNMLGGAQLSNLPSFDEVLGPLIRQQMTEFPVFAKAPFFFRLQALFPYIQGASFIEQGLRRADWKSLNVLFTSPPTSTKAISQPDVYFNHVSLPAVQLPRPTPLSSVPGLKMLDENTLGELGFNALLGQFLSEDRAKADSSGWMADRYIVYEDRATQSYALAARTRWANSEAALTFFRDYHSVLTQKYPELSPDSRSTAERFIGHTASGEIVMLRAGDEVRWAEGVPSDRVDAMAKWLASLQ